MTFEVLFSLILYTVVYALVAVVVLRLFLMYLRKGLPDVSNVRPADEADSDSDAPVSFAY